MKYFVHKRRKSLKWLSLLMQIQKEFCINANNKLPIIYYRKEYYKMKKNTKKIRTYTVSSIYQSGENRPFIKITGKWLSNFGFDIGTKYKVFESKDILLIVKIK